MPKTKNGKVVGEGQFERVCLECGVKFRTDDERKIYHSRSCGNTYRSRRWFNRAADALKRLGK